jgi:hypothetical protein
MKLAPVDFEVSDSVMYGSSDSLTRILRLLTGAECFLQYHCPTTGEPGLQIRWWLFRAAKKLGVLECHLENFESVTVECYLFSESLNIVSMVSPKCW